jgi:hypothetical protein
MLLQLAQASSVQPRVPPLINSITIPEVLMPGPKWTSRGR